MCVLDGVMTPSRSYRSWGYRPLFIIISRMRRKSRYFVLNLWFPTKIVMSRTILKHILWEILPKREYHWYYADQECGWKDFCQRRAACNTSVSLIYGTSIAMARGKKETRQWYWRKCVPGTGRKKLQPVPFSCTLAVQGRNVWRQGHSCVDPDWSYAKIIWQKSYPLLMTALLSRMQTCVLLHQSNTWSSHCSFGGDT